MRYLIKLLSTRFRAENNKFAIFIAKSIDESEQANGLAYIVFKNTVPHDDDHHLEIWGDWENSDKYGQQFVVRSWIHHDSTPLEDGIEESPIEPAN